MADVHLIAASDPGGCSARLLMLVAAADELDEAEEDVQKRVHEVENVQRLD